MKSRSHCEGIKYGGPRGRGRGVWVGIPVSTPNELSSCGSAVTGNDAGTKGTRFELQVGPKREYNIIDPRVSVPDAMHCDKVTLDPGDWPGHLTSPWSRCHAPRPLPGPHSPVSPRFRALIFWMARSQSTAVLAVSLCVWCCVDRRWDDVQNDSITAPPRNSIEACPASISILHCRTGVEANCDTAGPGHRKH